MKVAILSDIHDNLHNLVLALKEIESRNVERILVLGDLINGGIAKILASQEIPVFSIWGNNDGEKVEIMRKSMQEGSNLTMASTVFAFIEIDGRKIFLTHYPELAIPMAKSGGYDAVFYGHDHLKHKEMVKKTLVANPGEISAHKKSNATFMVYDTKINDVEFIELKNSVHIKTDSAKEYIKDLKFAFKKNI